MGSPGKKPFNSKFYTSTCLSNMVEDRCVCKVARPLRAGVKLLLIPIPLHPNSQQTTSALHMNRKSSGFSGADSVSRAVQVYYDKFTQNQKITQDKVTPNRASSECFHCHAGNMFFLLVRFRLHWHSVVRLNC